MLRVYFDDELIDVEAYTELDNEYKLFTDTFKLGSVASNTFKLSVSKSAVNSQPTNVRIEDDDTVMNFVVDNVTEDDYVYAYTLTDKLLNFNFDYDASVLINSKAELGEDCYLSDIWKDMCLQASVEYDETYVFENDIVVNWYDSRVQARRYLSYIAELQSGYACILENGKQSFKKQNRSSVKTIDADECSDLIIGEKKTITRVVYDGGAFKWEFGDDTGDTLYLQSDNVFIVNEGIVENIYNNIKDFEFYIIDVPQAPMDSTIKAGDIITFDDNGKYYPTIAQYTMSYAGGWTGGYKLSVNTERQQETQVSRVADNVKSLQVDVNRLDNEFGIIAEDITKLTDYIKNVGMTGNYLRLEETPESNGAINKLSIKGFELMPLYPNMTYPSEYTYPEALNFYTLILSDKLVTYTDVLPTPSQELEDRIFNVGGLDGKNYKCVKALITRNIQIGDNLSNKTIYCDFPENVEIYSTSGEWARNVIITTGGDIREEAYYLPWEDYQSVYVRQTNHLEEIYQRTTVGGEVNTYINLPVYELPSNFGTVTAISDEEDYKSYQYIKIVVDGWEWVEIENNISKIEINSPIPLQKLGSVHDELLIEANKVKVIQRIGYDWNNEQWSVLSTPITHELNDVLLPTFDGDTFVSVKYFDNLIYNAEYIVKNDLTSTFATQLESSSQFRINQDEITSKVSKDNLISEINQTAEQVRITADKIKFEGVVTANENFKILQDGSIEANNGLFRGNVRVANTNLVDKDLGVFTVILITNENLIGQQVYGRGGGYQLVPEVLDLNFYIPTDFTITEAKIILKQHRTVHRESLPWPIEINGKLTNINLYKGISGRLKTITIDWDLVDFGVTNNGTLVSAFDGYTAPNTNENITTSTDIKNHITSGLNSFFIGNGQTYEEFGYQTQTEYNNTVTPRLTKSAWASVTLMIYGYIK